MASRVAALLLLAVICIGFAESEILVDCCMSVTDKPVRRSHITSFHIQEGMGCSINATVLVTKIGRSLCVPHPNKSEWVKKLIRNRKQAVTRKTEVESTLARMKFSGSYNQSQNAKNRSCH
ncbi:C-C motif chemokine 19b [Lampris incognitus]|uniref:C-C motif chemokine 19b n=1 Tax=Lampris incognitus TaxID=2546036 RepID=UPI0024B616EF|nr:C-C motif chemokine 19b [Lampris incognitus]